MQTSYSNYKGQIDNLRWEIENADEVVGKLSATLNDITNNILLKDPTVALNNNDLVSEIALSNYNENILPSAGDCSIQKIVKNKGKEDCATILASSTKINKQIAQYRQQKRQQFDLF